MKPHLYQSSVLPAISHIALLNMGMGLGLIVSHAGWYEPIQKELLQFGWSVLHLCSAGPQRIQICKIQNMLAKIYMLHKNLYHQITYLLSSKEQMVNEGMLISSTGA